MKARIKIVAHRPDGFFAHLLSCGHASREGSGDPQAPGQADFAGTRDRPFEDFHSAARPANAFDSCKTLAQEILQIP